MATTARRRRLEPRHRIQDVQEATTIFARILVGFDGSPESRGALRLAERLGDASATVVLAPLAEELAGRARGAACDLIVLGDRRQHGGGRAVLGETADATLRTAGCAVAITPPEPVASLRAVGVGFDGSPAGRRALTVAARVATERRARLVVLSVVDPHHAYAPAGTSGDYGDVQRVAREALRTAVAGLDGVGDVHRQLHEGDPVHEVLALGRDVDLLVLGGAAVGGVGAAVVRRTRQAVLVVPEPNGAAAVVAA